MGIRGLMSFLKRKRTFEKYELSETRLVIDGKALSHSLMKKDDKKYGGNYDTFSVRVEQFFCLLKQCNVMPFVVIDGGMDADDKKIQCLLKRCKEKIDKVSKGKTGSPVLGSWSFRTTLKRMGVPIVTCPYEADREIAVLAKLWQCPILSDDSDFCVFDLPGGVIRISDIRLDIYLNDTTCTSINTYIYFCSNACNVLGIQPPMLSLLAALMPGDYLTLRYQVRQRFASRILKTSPENLQRMFESVFHAIVEALKEVKTLSNGQELLRDCVWSEESMTFEEKQTALKCVSMVLQYFDIQKNIPEYTVADDRFVDEELSHKLPNWVGKSIRHCIISSFIINAVNGRVILKAKCEDLGQPYVQSIASGLRQIVYKMVIDSTPSRQYVTEYHRVNLVMSETRVFPEVKLPNVYSFQEIEEMDLKSRLEYLCSIFEFPPVKMATIPEVSRLFVLCFNYFTRNTYLRESRKGQKCLLFSHMLLLWKSSGSLYGQPLDRDTVEQVFDFCKDDSNLEFDIQLIHELQRFQVLVSFMYNMNGLLRCPMSVASPSIMYKGSLMYPLFTKTRSDRELDSIVERVFSGNSVLEKTFKDILVIIKENLVKK